MIFTKKIKFFLVTDPCQDRSLHDCDPVAECYSEQPGYFQCKCPKGFADVSPDSHFPGRKCKNGLFSIFYWTKIIFYYNNHKVKNI